ncbi:hypothetical protein INT43_001747, partial [Umbelopsis isabellina]
TTSQPKSSTEIDDIFSKKKNASEIDDIFAKKPIGKKPKDTVEDEVDSQEENDEAETASSSKATEEVVFAELAAVKASKKRAAPPKIADDDGFSDSRGKKSKRMTDDGYPLYDVKDLNIGLGGDTPECPFDCTCCKFMCYT